MVVIPDILLVVNDNTVLWSHRHRDTTLFLNGRP